MGKETVCIKAPAKINLGLDITGRRKDGYHLVKMVMQTVSLYDEVTVKRTSECVDMELFTEDGKRKVFKIYEI
jgi:4-diphosphocytidyl-2-C-methyl-D-erythritol kinase